MIRIAILEDDPAQEKRLRLYLDKYAAGKKLVFSVESFSKGEDLLLAYHGNWDLLFLDIMLPGINGMQVARQIRNHDNQVCIIFITSLAHYAVEGYSVDALDFIVKPAVYAQVVLKLDKAMREIRKNNGVQLQLNTRDGLYLLPSRDLVFAEISNHNMIYHTETQVLQCRGKMSELEETLTGQGFLRISAGYLINLSFLMTVNNLDVLLTTGERLVISRARKKEVYNAIARYLGGGSDI